MFELTKIILYLISWLQGESNLSNGINSIDYTGQMLPFPLFIDTYTLECPRLWRITDLSLMVNKQDQRTMKTAIKIFLAFPSF